MRAEPQRSPRQTALPAAILAAALALSASVARADELRWRVRGLATWVSPAGDELVSNLPTGESFRFGVEDGVGFAGEIELRFKSHFGVEIAAIYADMDSELVVAAAGALLVDVEESVFEAYSAGVNYHWPVAARTDLHVGVFTAIVYYDDVIFLTEAGRFDKLVFDDDIGFGLKLGVDRSFGASERWSLSLAARYLSAILEGEAAGQDMDLDPIVVSIGVGYRF